MKTRLVMLVLAASLMVSSASGFLGGTFGFSDGPDSIGDLVGMSDGPD